MNILNDITLFLVTYNNNKLTSLVIKSFFKSIGTYIPVVIMDNGTREFCTDDMKEVFTIIDNTNYKIIPNQNQLSRNHCASVDYALKNCINTKYVLLCDSDVLFKPSVKTLLENYNGSNALGEIAVNNMRLMPMFCIIDLEQFKKDNVNYYDKNRCLNNFTSILDEQGNWIKDIIKPDKWYGDTGASFLWDIQKLNWNITNIKMVDYIEHYGRASFDEKHKNITITEWLNKFKNLWS